VRGISKSKVQITERALIQRLNRRLAHDGWKLLTARGYWNGRDKRYSYTNTDIGRHYIVDLFQNTLLWMKVDLEWWGRKLNVLAPWEVLAQ
jgi:hypothetical protein